ncbi:hypothetical protein [Deinococcus sp. Marseille-Q6407]|uniref:hypothetical protein n=1 Tax=Deinococcus sp. Marseille-Q6407 TaxID=2969223 RepID=UPI0021BE5275|nr:hypothetical protein [Deinococcus sp. Marseille-Q6407]
MKRRPGTFGTLPNWVLAALPALDPTSSLILIRVAYSAGLKRPAVTLGALLDYTGRSSRQLDRSLARLTASGLLTLSPDGYVLGAGESVATPDDKSDDTTGDTDDDKSDDKNVQNRSKKSCPAQQTPRPEEVEEERKDINLLTHTVSESDSGEPESMTTTSQKTPAAPRVPVQTRPDDFAAAAQLFHRLVNANFVNNNTAHIQRWAEEYSEAFIRQAWQIARTDSRLSRVPMAGLVWLLDGTKPWPEELKKQFQRDQNAALEANVPAGSEQPRPGEIRVCGARSGPVLDVDVDSQMLTLQIGADASESIWVPWSSTQPAMKVSPAPRSA